MKKVKLITITLFVLGLSLVTQRAFSSNNYYQEIEIQKHLLGEKFVDVGEDSSFSKFATFKAKMDSFMDSFKIDVAYQDLSAFNILFYEETNFEEAIEVQDSLYSNASDKTKYMKNLIKNWKPHYVIEDIEGIDCWLDWLECFYLGYNCPCSETDILNDEPDSILYVYKYYNISGFEIKKEDLIELPKGEFFTKRKINQSSGEIISITKHMVIEN